MELYLKITVCLLLIVQTFHLALLQDSTDSPGRTINQGWLRELLKGHKDGNKKAPVAKEEPGFESEPYADAMDSNNDDGAGVPSGSMTLFGDENMSSREMSENKTSGVLLVSLKFSNRTIKKHKMSNTTVAPTTTTTIPTNSSQRNMTGAEEESHNSTMTNQTSTADSIPHNSTMTNQTSTPHAIPPHSTTFSNRTHLHPTTLAPKINATQQPPEKNKGLNNGTTTAATTTTPGLNETSITSSSTAAFPSDTTGTGPVPTTPLAPITPEKANKTDKDGASGSSADRGLTSDQHKHRRNGVWAAVLGTGVAIAIVGLVVYVILKKKHQMGFSHRKLVEVYPSDPVLRLDNSEPLDLNFGGRVYDNPGLQGDNFQMSNFPGRH
ncbi:mucin-15 [Hippoglossus hippoglossus]|uniref:mucin-15 n=1 Tax=Hippoglossus hippoglossus TaxID=8267 RepID=UPI00148CCCDC|nr:mucin-15 [Hippoglossus hippoglossus]